MEDNPHSSTPVQISLGGRPQTRSQKAPVIDLTHENKLELFDNAIKALTSLQNSLAGLKPYTTPSSISELTQADSSSLLATLSSRPETVTSLLNPIDVEKLVTDFANRQLCSPLRRRRHRSSGKPDRESQRWVEPKSGVRAQLQTSILTAHASTLIHPPQPAKKPDPVQKKPTKTKSFSL